MSDIQQKVKSIVDKIIGSNVSKDKGVLAVEPEVEIKKGEKWNYLQD